MTYMRSWKSHRLTPHTWLGLIPQIGRPLSRIVVPLVYFFYMHMNQRLPCLFVWKIYKYFEFLRPKYQVRNYAEVRWSLFVGYPTNNTHKALVFKEFIWKFVSPWIKLELNWAPYDFTKLRETSGSANRFALPCLLRSLLTISSLQIFYESNKISILL
jgi:hypothetical protein